MSRQSRHPRDNGQQAGDLFGSIRSRIAQRDHGVVDDRDLNDGNDDGAADGGAGEEGITVDLAPIATRPLGDSSTQGPAPPTVPVSKLGAGHVLRGRYVIESQLGSGGMGTVYKAIDRSRSEHTETDARVAIKVLHEQTRGRADVLSKLRREFYCAQALSHESVVKVYELDLDQDFPFFTMEFIDGENLPKVMRRFHPEALPRDYVWGVIREVGGGLAHAHDRRVIHGDMKPQNIMVTNSGEVRILDFGTAGDSATALTPAYASCELLEGEEPDPRDDLFALACLSYELLAGEHPFKHLRSTEARTLKMMPRRPSGLTGKQWKVLNAALAWGRADRPRSVREWLAELNLGHEPLGPVPRPQDAKRLSLLKGGKASAIIALLAAVVVSGIVWTMLSSPKVPAVAVTQVPEPDETPLPALNLDKLVQEGQSEEPSAQPAAPKSTAKIQTAGHGLAAEPSVGATPTIAAAPTIAGPAHPVDRTERIGFTASAYAIRRGQKFAEIRVQRSFASKGSTSFQWQTEAGSAVAGTDFAPQAPTVTFFPGRVRTVSLFVKILPNASRKRTQVFYIVLSNPNNAKLLSGASKAAISLNP